MLDKGFFELNVYLGASIRTLQQILNSNKLFFLWIWCKHIWIICYYICCELTSTSSPPPPPPLRFIFPPARLKRPPLLSCSLYSSPGVVIQSNLLPISIPPPSELIHKTNLNSAPGMQNKHRRNVIPEWVAFWRELCVFNFMVFTERNVTRVTCVFYYEKYDTFGEPLCFFCKIKWM